MKQSETVSGGVASEFERAVQAWLRYHVATETYDRSLTTLRSPETGDAVIHLDPIVRDKSYAFARDQLRLLDLATRDISSDANQRAKELVCSWSYEAQRIQLAACP